MISGMIRLQRGQVCIGYVRHTALTFFLTHRCDSHATELVLDCDCADTDGAIETLLNLDQSCVIK